MSKNTITIDGLKLKRLLETRSGLSLYDLSEKEGFSRNFLPQACRHSKASPIVQSVASRYGVRKEEYILKEDLKQMTIDDIETYKVNRERLEAVIKGSRKTYSELSDATNEALNKSIKAYEDLRRAWAQALAEYEDMIRQIQKEVENEQR